MESAEDRNYLFERNLLKAFLFEASLEGRYSIPTDKVLILSSLVKGVVDYLGVPISAEEAQLVQPNPFDAMARAYPSREEALELFYQWKVAEAEVAGKKLQPRVRQALESLVEFRWEEHAAPDRGGFPNPKLYEHISGGGFGFGILPVSFGDVVSLPAPFCFSVKEKVYPYLTSEEGSEVRGIGGAMRKRLVEDFSYWREHRGFKSA